MDDLAPKDGEQWEHPGDPVAIFDGDNTCVECEAHIAEPHAPGCPYSEELELPPRGGSASFTTSMLAALRDPTATSTDTGDVLADLGGGWCAQVKLASPSFRGIWINAVERDFPKNDWFQEHGETYAEAAWWVHKWRADYAAYRAFTLRCECGGLHEAGEPHECGFTEDPGATDRRGELDGRGDLRVFTIAELAKHVAANYDMSGAGAEGAVRAYVDQLIGIDGSEAVIADADTETLTNSASKQVLQAVIQTAEDAATEQELSDAVSDLEIAESTLAERRARRDAAIRAALAGGMRYKDVQAITGLSRGMVDGIRRGLTRLG